MQPNKEELIITLVDSLELRKKLNQIYQEVYVEEQRIDPELVFSTPNLPVTEHILLINNEPACTGRFKVLQESKEIKIERMATLKEHRGKKFGEKMLQSLINQANKEYPNFKIILHSQKSANTFYENLGWVKVGDEFLEANIVHQKYFYPGKE